MTARSAPTGTAYQRVQEEDAKAAVRALSDFVNNFGHDPAMFVEYLQREHRTLQQSMTGLMLLWIEHLAGLKEHEYDLRNEASVKMARLIWPVIKYNFYQRLPLI